MAFLRPFGQQGLDHYRYQIKNLKAQINNASNSNQHAACNQKMAKLRNLITSLRANVQKQLKTKEAMEAQLNLEDRKINTVMTDLSKSSREVQRLRIQNYTLEKQLQHNYDFPDQYFRTDSQAEFQQVRESKAQRISKLKAELERLRHAQNEGIKDEFERISSEQLEKDKYQRLVLENEQIKKIIRQAETVNGSSISAMPPELTALANINKQLETKVSEFDRHSKYLSESMKLQSESLVKLRSTNSHLKQRNSRLAQSVRMSGPAALPVHPLEQKYKSLQLQYLSLKSQQTLKQNIPPTVQQSQVFPVNLSSPGPKQQQPIDVSDSKSATSSNKSSRRKKIFDNNNNQIMLQTKKGQESPLKDSRGKQANSYNLVQRLDLTESPEPKESAAARKKQEEEAIPLRGRYIQPEPVPQYNQSRISAASNSSNGNKPTRSRINPQLYAMANNSDSQLIVASPKKQPQLIAEKKVFDIKSMFDRWD